MTRLLLVTALAFVVPQQQCDLKSMVAGKAIESIHDYFPNAETVSVAPCYLVLDTKVRGVGKRLLMQIAQRLASSPETRQLHMGMEFAGYNYFALAFNYWVDESGQIDETEEKFIIVYARYQQVWYVFDENEWKIFFSRAPNFCVG